MQRWGDHRKAPTNVSSARAQTDHLPIGVVPEDRMVSDGAAL
ncbi:MAG TPA: hypothetical protein VFG23_17905 [Polyangia bacterium]|nr:hypothetical protein [Polyangia bacterium]